MGTVGRTVCIATQRCDCGNVECAGAVGDEPWYHGATTLLAADAIPIQEAVEVALVMDWVDGSS